VIGVLAVIAIAAFCVWYFVLRAPNEGVEPAPPSQPTAAPSPD
jgi:hypothetical protein